MPVKLVNRALVNPTHKENAHLMHSLFKDKYTEIQAYAPFVYQGVEYTFTHDMYLFRKHRTDSPKKERIYYVVSNPNFIAEGVFGSVHNVPVVWKHGDTVSNLKSKTDPYKQKLVKMAFLPDNPDSADFIVESYQSEQKLGSNTPHMGLKYAPTELKGSVRLLMRKQPGCSLQQLIDEVKKNPLRLSVTERLKITINLLQKLDSQLHGVELPSSDPEYTPYIVHRDIKPANIMVDSDGVVNFIDYGLAVPSNIDTRSEDRVGSEIWMDPYHYDNFQDENQDMYTDLGSLARVIAELWGDVSRVIECTEDDLIDLNNDNITLGLCENIVGLSIEEKENLIRVIKTMTSYYMEDRLTREEALDEFEKILAGRRSFLQSKLKEPLATFSADLIAELLKSEFAGQFIQKAKDLPEEWPGILDKIKPILCQLDASTLQALHTNKLHFAPIKISVDYLAANINEPEKILLLMKLGATLEPGILTRWFNHQCEDNLRWAQMYRALHQVTQYTGEESEPNRDNDNFKSEFYWRYIYNKETVVDDETNVRLLQEHIKARQVEKAWASTIFETVKPALRIEPLFMDILRSDLLTPSDTLILAPRTHFESLSGEVASFCKLVERADALKPSRNRPLRDKALTKLQADIQNRKKLKGHDWQSALSDTKELNDRLYLIEELDSCYEQLNTAAGADATASLKAELESYYQKQTTDLANLKSNVGRVINGFDQVRSILSQARIKSANIEKVEIELESILAKTKLNKGEHFLTSLEMFSTTQSIIDSRDPLDTERQFIYTAFKNNLLRIIPKMNAEEVTELQQAYKSFMVHEQQFKKQLVNNPRVMHYIYSILKDKLSCPLNTDNISSLCQLMAECNRQRRLTPAFVMRIEDKLRELEALKDQEGYKSKLKAFKTSIWRFLNDQPQTETVLSKSMHGFFPAAKPVDNSAVFPTATTSLSWSDMADD